MLTRDHQSLLPLASFVLAALLTLSAPTARADAVPAWDWTVVAEHPHSPRHFTQGLLIHGDWLYEGTGRYGHSAVLRMDKTSGEILARHALDDQYFGEGIAIAGETLFQLTWRARRVFRYDPQTLTPTGSDRLRGEGWGLTFDGEHLIVSDGSAQLRFYQPEDMHRVRTVTVTEGAGPHARPRDQLNELEWINGKVLANVWRRSEILVIDPHTGLVQARLDLSALVAANRSAGAEGVLNGVAFDPADGTLWVTGKLWPTLYQLRVPALLPQASAD